MSLLWGMQRCVTRKLCGHSVVAREFVHIDFSIMVRSVKHHSLKGCIVQHVFSVHVCMPVCVHGACVCGVHVCCRHVHV